MEPKEKILNQFAELVEKDKFSTEEWNKRGLNPSDENVIAYMNSRLEIVMAELILAVDKNSSKRTLKKILKKGLARYRRIDLDTEEAEFIVDYFELFAHILEISAMALRFFCVLANENNSFSKARTNTKYKKTTLYKMWN